MGTSTLFIRMNDYKKPFVNFTQKELEQLDLLSPYSDSQYGPAGIRISFELHNKNIYPLIMWRGDLFKLEDAPKKLKKKYYDRYKGTYRREYEWTLLKKYLLQTIEYLDCEFKKEIRKTSKKK